VEKVDAPLSCGQDRRSGEEEFAEIRVEAKKSAKKNEQGGRDEDIF